MNVTTCTRVALALIALATTSSLRAQSCDSSIARWTSTAGTDGRLVVEFDQARRGVRLIGRDTSPLLCPGLTVEPRSVRRVSVRLRGTNTAFYQARLEREDLPDPYGRALQSFVGNPLVRRLVPELAGRAASAIRGRGGEDLASSSMFAARPAPISAALARAYAAAEQVENDLADFDHAVHADSGIVATYATALASLERMRGGADPDAESARFRAKTHFRPEARTHWMTQTLVASSARLVGNADALALAWREAAADAGPSDAAAITRLRASGDAALQAFPELLALSYRVEALSTRVATALADIPLGAADKPSTKGPQRLRVRWTPASEPEVARLAGPAGTLEVTLAHDALMRPVLGGALLFVPGARFEQWGTRAVTGGHEVFAAKMSDARLGQGLSLGLGWRGMARRVLDDVRVALPDIVVPLGSGRSALGVGVGVGRGNLQVGAGLMWIRHEVLVGSYRGAVLSSADQLRTSDSYATPKPYLSIVWSGLPTK